MTAGSSVPEAARAAASDRAVLDRFFARASGKPGRGLADYVQERRREGHRVTLTKDGEYGGCSCGDVMCSIPFWLTWCDQLIRSYEVKVDEFSAETRRTSAAVAAAVAEERATTGRRIEAAVDVAVASWLDDQWVRVLGPEERLQGVLAVERAVRSALASPGEGE